MPTQLDEIKNLRAYIQSSGVGARLCPAPHAGRLALGQNLGSLLHCHGAGQQRLVVQVLRPMHQHGDPTEWGLVGAQRIRMVVAHKGSRRALTPLGCRAQLVIQVERDLEAAGHHLPHGVGSYHRLAPV